MSQQPAQLLKVRVLTPKQTLFEGTAFSVSSKNSKGKFDILPGHANFITIVQTEPVEIRRENNQKTEFKFSEAIIYAMNNEVRIFAEPQTI